MTVCSTLNCYINETNMLTCSIGHQRKNKISLFVSYFINGFLASCIYNTNPKKRRERIGVYNKFLGFFVLCYKH